ncbi:MAG: tetratricopeptide repeat protein [Clostridiales bacterium]|nr:tetratricopeptide repeat protein [Clostridiales bacterium]
MNIFGNGKAARAGTQAYRCHLDGNKLLEAGKIQEARKKHDEALRLYAEAFQDGLDRVGMLMSYGILLMRDGQYEKARDVFLRVHYKAGLTKDERFELRINYSVCLWRLGKLTDAIATIKRAAEDGKTTTIYTTLGLFLVLEAEQTGVFSEAVAFNEEALEYDDEDAAILDNLGLLHMALCEQALKASDSPAAAERRRLAYDYLGRAHKRRPRQVTTLYYLAKLLHEDGQDERAGEFIDAALAGNFSAICPVSREMAGALRKEIPE